MLTLGQMPLLGDRLRELRNKKDLSLREMARQVGNVTAAHLSDIEFGRRHPSDHLLHKLADLFDVPVDEFRQLDTRPPIEQIRRASSRDPQYGVAFRKIVDSKLSGEDILALLGEDKKTSEDQ